MHFECFCFLVAHSCFVQAKLLRRLRTETSAKRPHANRPQDLRRRDLDESRCGDSRLQLKLTLGSHSRLSQNREGLLMAVSTACSGPSREAASSQLSSSNSRSPPSGSGEVSLKCSMHPCCIPLSNLMQLGARKMHCYCVEGGWRQQCGLTLHLQTESK